MIYSHDLGKIIVEYFLYFFSGHFGAWGNNAERIEITKVGQTK